MKENKLFAEFLEWQVLNTTKEKITTFDNSIQLSEAGEDIKHYKYCHKQQEYWKKDIVPVTLVNKKDWSLFGISTELDKCKFSSDWNWLMVVVEKIESLGFDVMIDSKSSAIIYEASIIADNCNLSKIENVYQACLQFIKQYNG